MPHPLRRLLPAILCALVLFPARTATAQNLIGVSIPVGSMDSMCMPVADGVYSVNPLNVNLGIGYLVNPVSTPDFSLHDHQYVSPHVPDPTRAVVTYTFNGPVIVSGIQLVQHTNGITQIEGFVGPDEASLVSIGTIFGPSGDIEGHTLFSEGQIETFTFPNPQPGKIFRFIVRKTSLEDGWANYHAFPLYTATGNFISSLNVTPSPLLGSKTVTGTVTLSAPAPAEGATVTLGKTGLPAATVPASVKVPAGMTSKTFTIKTAAVAANQSGTIEAAYNGYTSSTPLTIRGVIISALTLSPTIVVGPAASTATVKLEIPVPAALGSVDVALSSSIPGAAAPSSPTLTFLTGEQTKTFTVNTFTVSANTVVNISAASNGAAQTKPLTVKRPLGVAALTLLPAAVYSPAATSATVKLDAPVPASAGSVTVSLSSDSAAATPSAPTLVFNVGEQTKSIIINTSVVAAKTTANITATANGIGLSKPLTVNKPIGVSSLTLNPATVVGPDPSIGTVKLDAPVPPSLGSITVNLTSSSGAAVLGTATLTFGVGEQFKQFSISTADVTTTLTANITASTATSTQTKKLTIK